MTALIALLGAELFLRAWHPAPSYGVEMLPWPQGLFEHDARLGWRGRPDVRDAPFVADMFRTRVSLNVRGHRSTAEPWQPERRNALVLGDSQGWGWGVEDDEVFSERMMALDPGWNVYNLSVPGYGTDQQLLALRGWLEEHPRARVDAVLLLFSTNDFVDVTRSMADFHQKPVFVLEGGRLRLRNVPVPKQRRPDFAGNRQPVEEPGRLRGSHLWNLTSWNAALVLGSARRNQAPAQDFVAGYDLTVTLIEALHSSARARDAELFVVVLPARRDEIPWARLEADLRERGFAVRGFPRRTLPRNTHWRDGHLNARGHDQLARLFLEQLKSGT